MSQISVEKLFELSIDTSKRCLSSTCDQSEDDMAYDIFEVFDTGVTSFFYDDALERLRTAGMISEEAAVASQRIRQFWIDLDPYSFRLDEIRSHPKWGQLFSMCDELQLILNREKQKRESGASGFWSRLGARSFKRRQ